MYLYISSKNKFSDLVYQNKSNDNNLVSLLSTATIAKMRLPKMYE